MLDGSASITSTDWYSVKDFTTEIVNAFNVSVDGAEIGAVQFSSRDPLFPIVSPPAARTIIGLSSDAAAIKAAVNKERQVRGARGSSLGPTAPRSGTRLHHTTLRRTAQHPTALATRYQRPRAPTCTRA